MPRNALKSWTTFTPGNRQETGATPYSTPIVKVAGLNGLWNHLTGGGR
jgi:hypothetical protein